jgi:hypothetical protein
MNRESPLTCQTYYLVNQGEFCRLNIFFSRNWNKIQNGQAFKTRYSFQDPSAIESAEIRPKLNIEAFFFFK